MFKTKDREEISPADHTGNLKVLQLSLDPEKQEPVLEAWVSAGWRLTDTCVISSGGQSLFVLAYLSRR